MGPVVGVGLVPWTPSSGEGVHTAGTRVNQLVTSGARPGRPCWRPRRVEQGRNATPAMSCPDGASTVPGEDGGYGSRLGGGVGRCRGGGLCVSCVQRGGGASLCQGGIGGGLCCH